MLKSNQRYSVERVKRGRRNLGDLVTFNHSEQTIYLAARKLGDMYRDGRKSLSEAMREGVAAWGLDNETLWGLKRKGIDIVGVSVRDTGDFYLTRLDYYFDPNKIQIKNWSARGGTLTRYLPLKHFAHRAGEIKF